MNIKAIQYKFKDTGKIPNSKYPMLIYRNVFNERGNAGAEWLEKLFAKNNWTNSWRNGVYDYHHYHSITHEVLGVFQGNALLHLGGEEGEKIQVSAGDIIVIPAGVGHKNLRCENFQIVGAYPNGSDYDINKGEKGERPEADHNIFSVPIPNADPLLGKLGGVPELWRD